MLKKEDRPYDRFDIDVVEGDIVSLTVFDAKKRFEKYTLRITKGVPIVEKARRVYG